MVGGAYLVLQDGMVSEYKTVPLNSSMKGWKSKWFYTENVEDGISTDIYSSTKPNPNWMVLTFLSTTAKNRVLNLLLPTAP